MPMDRWRATDLAALGAALAFIILGYLTRDVLNPDGVSYLDLAGAVQRGEWRQYVQGYWSPLLPLVTAILGDVTGRSGPQLITLAHALSVVAALVALATIWWWARRHGTPVFGRMAIAALLLCSFGPPRFESLTPDILLLCVMVALSYELLARSSRRWLVIGVLLGVAFLVKTSIWPLLVVAVPLRLWAAPDAPARGRVLWSTSVCAFIVSLWVVPMSLEAGRFTLGSSGRLNAGWYLLGDLSQLPDSDPGRHSRYEEIPVGRDVVTLATFDDAARWTYQPWGDPGAWADGVETLTRRTPTPELALAFWLRNTGITLGKWLLPMMLAVLVPTFLVQRRTRMWRELLNDRRDALVVMALGAAGLAQFIAIHIEPRLTAPFACMLALGFGSWCCGKDSDRPMAPLMRLGLSWIGVLGGVVFALSQVPPNLTRSIALEDQIVRTARLREQLEAGDGSPRIAVVGPAIELMSLAYQAGAHISAQILPRSVAALSALSPEQQRDMLTAMLRGKATQVWRASENGVMMWPVSTSHTR